MDKKKQMRIIIGVYIISLICTSRTGLSLVLSNIAEQFPDASPASVQLVFTLANGAGLFGSILMGVLAGKMKKKNMMILFMALTVVGGVIGYFGYATLALLYLSSLVLGIAIGAADPLGTAFLTDAAAGDGLGKWIGIKSFFVSVGGMITTFLAGMLAKTEWRNVYLVFIGAILMVLVSIFIFPGSEAAAGQAQAQEEKGGKLMNPTVGMLFLLNFLVAVTWVVYNSNVSFLLGGNTQASGNVTIIFMAGMTVAGFLVAPAQKIFKNYAIPVFMAVTAGSLWLFTQCQDSILLLGIGSALLGIGFCVYTALAFSYLPAVATPGTTSRTIAYFSAVTTLGALVHPYLVTIPAGWVSESVMARFYWCAIILTVGTVIGFIFFSKKKN